MAEIIPEKDATHSLLLPRTERNRASTQAAEAAAQDYEANSPLPVAERELTAFTALDGEPFFDGEDEDKARTSCVPIPYSSDIQKVLTGRKPILYFGEDAKYKLSVFKLH